MGRDGSFDVFLSYARSDGAAAAELNGWLQAQGLRTFFDRGELRPGLRWVPGLEDAIGRSDAVAILVGRHGIGNTQQYERELALVRQTRDGGFPIIPVLMPGCENPPTGFLQLLTWIDFSRGDSLLQQTESLWALRAAICRQSVQSSPIRALICPYRGLETFREEDAAFFCGRDDAIRDLVARVQEHAFVAVVGPSGSGKSSLVFAGLLPALRQQRETTIWDVVSFRPGASPLRALAAAFGTVPENIGPARRDAILEDEAAAYRAGNEDKLSRIVNGRLDAAPEKPDRLLIYVDQWEELYAMAPAAEDAERLQQHSGDAERFIALLVAAASGQTSRAAVVLTVRADFYNPLIRHTLLSTLLPRQQANIPPMGSSGLRSAIETPAKKARLSFDPPALVDRILSDVGAEEGKLPLLQFALKETWEGREGDRLTAKAYTEVGGVTGAIEKTAERAYAALTPAQQEAARRLFLRLVTPGEGQEDTRARSAIPDDPQQRDIISRFSNRGTRLLVTGYDALQGPAAQAESDEHATVEVAHEALIRRWQTLRGWVDGNRDKLRARTVILRAKAEWEERGKIDKFLVDPGVQLERGRDLLGDPGDVPVDDIRNYVNLSIEKEKRRLDAEREAALADQKRIADAEHQAKEAAEEAARQSEAARTVAEGARRKLRKYLIVIASMGGIALLAFGFSAVEWNAASQNALETQRQLDRANKALAEGILNDLDLKYDKPLTARQRNALWKLARANEAVKREFISALSASPEDLVRISAQFGEVCRSLGLERPSPAEAEKLFAGTVAALEWEKSARSVVIAIQVLAPKVRQSQAQQALAPVLKQIGRTADSETLQAMAEAIQALAPKLAEEQTQQTLASLLPQIGETSFWLRARARVIRALGANLTDAQVQQALAPALAKIGQTTDPYEVLIVAQAIQEFPAKLSEVQAQLVLAPMLRWIGQTTDSEVFRVLAQAIQALPTKLTDAQAGRVLTPLLRQFTQTTDSAALRELAQAIQALAPKLTEAQAEQLLAPVLQQFDQTTDPAALRELAQAIHLLPAKVSEAQAQLALAPVLRQIGQTTDSTTFTPQAGKVLAPQAGEWPAPGERLLPRQALSPLLQQTGKPTDSAPVPAKIGQTTDPDKLQALAPAIEALAGKLTEAQAQQALYPLLQQIGLTTDLGALKALAQAIRALPAKLTEVQAQQALAPLLQQIGQKSDSDAALAPLAETIQVLAPKLTEAQAKQTLAPLLRQFGKTTNPDALQALAVVFQALAAKLTEVQAQQTLAPVLLQIGKTSDSVALDALAQVLQVLPTKLTEAQAQEALPDAASSLAWAATEEEAADWARALVGLLSRTTEQDGTRMLVTALVYPTAAGPATEVLLDAIRGGHLDTPAKEAGTEVSLAWVAEKYPDLVRRPTCPPPPQPTSISGLKCPAAEVEAPANPAGRVPRDTKDDTAG